MVQPMRPFKRKALDKENCSLDALTNLLEKINIGIRAKAEHPFRASERQFGYDVVRYRGLKKNTLQLTTLSTLWIVRHTVMAEHR